MLFKFLNLAFFAAFALSAAVQYNDPDALMWVAVYLAAALMCLLQYRNIRLPWLCSALFVIALVWIATLLTGIVGSVSIEEVFKSIRMQSEAVEEAREIGGLALVALWAGVLIYYQRPN